MVARIPITNVSPVVEQGKYPVKAVRRGVLHDSRPSVFREGHDRLAPVSSSPTRRARTDRSCT